MTDTKQTKRASYLAHTSPLLLGFVAFILLSGIFFTGLGIGFGLGRWGSGDSFFRPAAGAAASVKTCAEGIGGGGAASDLCPTFATFWEAMDLLYRDFYGELPDAGTATYGAIRGVIGLLDDPNTSFLTPEEANFFRTSLEGAFEGIGARVGWDEDVNTVIITEPFENQPAWSAGLRRDDLILAVDGESLVGTSLTEAVDRIRGPKGSTIVLTIQRAEFSDPFDVEVVRDRIEIPTISTGTLGTEGDISYVKLNSFSENSGQLVREAVRDALRREPSALIFDLRGNTGGLLREAVAVASVFMEEETVLLERFSDGETKVYPAGAEAVAGDIPMVVLVNSGSASASEIVAGALQDSGRASLIGTTTFGKGSVQLPHSLSDGGIMRVTVARWFTPNDRTIDGVGLEPDITVEVSEDQLDAGDDPQLEAAVKFLTSAAVGQ